MVTVKFFASLKDKAGASELQIAFSGGTVADLLQRVADACPALAEMLSSGSLMISVNHEFVRQIAHVGDGDEVALMPPFSGGSEAPGQVRIQREPFSLEREISRLKQASTAIGALVTFIGTTRDLSKGKRVAKLEFEHYPGMAEKKLREIRDRAIREFGVIDISIIHRVGTLPVGEDIVLIAVAAGHRDEAFTACRFCIDELKRITPIWKKETTPEGEVWVEEHP
ncbi:MAG TPA: molybdenum cofactor biosynthesis protein MoaE [Nitrospirota bacterium]|nr:molybdenum cofactor biosynthesis protein MoaE [Nitrospirota bacterium]